MSHFDILKSAAHSEQNGVKRNSIDEVMALFTKHSKNEEFHQLSFHVCIIKPCMAWPVSSSAGISVC